MAKSSLLPDSHDKFSDKEYWDDFFIKRKNEAFEWYGQFSDLKQYFVNGKLSKSALILVIGCGNSDLSVEIYDAGYTNILNIDFSELVIDEMKKKYSVSKPLMRWEVMDMTQMGSISSESVDLIVDKGALDALMSSDNMTTQLNAIKMFNEINRILTPLGAYLCISLAEEYIFTAMVSYFCDSERVAMNYKVDINIILKNASGGAANPTEEAKSELFLPFCFIIRKQDSTAVADAKPLPDVVPSNLYLHYDLFCNPLSPPVLLENTVIASEKVLEMQEYHRKCYKYRDITTGRFEVIDFHASDATIASYGSANANTNANATEDSSIPSGVPMTAEIFQKVPRFTITILDYSTIAQRNCAVFIIPLNREAEYQFSTEDGLNDIAISAACKRLIAVRCNKPHVFPKNMSGSSLQEELNGLIVSLLPAGTAPVEVPYMALEQDVSWSTIHSGSSSVSGGYIVEEKVNYKDLSDEPAAGAASIVSKQRRLIFLSSQQFVQTEVTLCPVYGDSAATATAGAKKSKKKSAPTGPITGWYMDNSVVDAHHCGVLVAMALASWRHSTTLSTLTNDPTAVAAAAAVLASGPVSSKNKKKSKGSSVCTSERLAGTMLATMHARLAGTASNCSAGAAAAAASASVLIIGLGGGSLSSAVSHCCSGASVYACDWDQAVIDVAREFFMYKDNRSDSNASTNNEGMYSLCANGVDLISHLVDKRVDNDAGVDDASVSSVAAAMGGLCTEESSASVLRLLTGDVCRRGLHVLVVDVDAKPTAVAGQGETYGQGITAPPVEFLTAEALSQYRTLLTPPATSTEVFHCGTLIINIVCRSDQTLDKLLERVASAYKHKADRKDIDCKLYLLRPSCENVNMLLVAVFTSTGTTSAVVKPPAIPSKIDSNLSNVPRRNLLVDADKTAIISVLNLWLQSYNSPHDPLSLKEFVSGNDDDSSIFEII